MTKPKGRKRRRGKILLPVFQPLYVDVIGKDKDGFYHKMHILKIPEYNSNYMRIYVGLP